MAPAGLGKKAAVAPTAELWKKKATDTGICKESHCDGVNSKSHTVRIALGYGPVPAAPRPPVGEEQVTGTAGADQAAVTNVDHMGVPGRDRFGAHFAAPAGGGRRGRLAEPGQDGQGPGTGSGCRRAGAVDRSGGGGAGCHGR